MESNLARRWRWWLKNYGRSTLAIAATLGWMAVTLLFLGSSDPPAPEAGSLPIALLGHLVLFGVLGFLASVTATTVSRSRRWVLPLVVSVLVGVLWGLFTEWYQTTLPGRSASLEDVLIDSAAAFAGGMVAGAVQLLAVSQGK